MQRRILDMLSTLYQNKKPAFCVLWKRKGVGEDEI